MHSRVFPLREQRTNTIDGIAPPTRTNRSVAKRASDRSPDSFAATVFSRGKRSSVVVFAKDGYVYPARAIDILGERPLFLSSTGMVDGLHKKGIVIPAAHIRKPALFVEPSREAFAAVERSFRNLGENVAAGVSGFRLGLSPSRAAYAPLVGAMALGMVSALLLEHSFGGGVKAEEARIVYVERPAEGERVLGAGSDASDLLDTEAILSDLAIEDPSKKEFEERVRNMVKGYPIEDMIPYIVEQDRTVAMFLVAIAKKESNWGRRIPVLDGQDCFNYWGYRGIRKMMGTGGHTCFNSREDAVDTVGKRLDTLINKHDLDTPADLILWKCGSSCAGHSPYSVKKWISDVDLYYQKLNKEGDA